MKQKGQSCMSVSQKSSRRKFLKEGGRITASTALAGVTLPPVHAMEENTIRLALIGCGNRGSGAVRDALMVATEPVQLYAMADLVQERLKMSYESLKSQFRDRIQVSQDRQFIGFDAYKQAIDLLRPGDVAMLTGYAAWRPVQLEYAVRKGVNVFMEKSFACDPLGARRIIRAGEEAKKKNLKIAAGLMCRHSRNRQQLIQKIRSGDLGEIQLVRANRMEPVSKLGQKHPEESELLWQIRNFPRFFWVSGGLFVEMTIHQIDEVCWLMDDWPQTAHGIGGRAPSSRDRSQNLDSHSIEYTFRDGAKALVSARYLRKCHNEFATFVHGRERAAQFSGHIHAGTVRTYRDHRVNTDNLDWEAEKEILTPWQAEWKVFLEAIRKDQFHNEANRAALSNLAAMMGRAAVHSGKVVTWGEVMNSNFSWNSDVDSMGYDTSPLLKADANGYYPVPNPGQWSEI